jgi:hypothetical protein
LQREQAFKVAPSEAVQLAHSLKIASGRAFFVSSILDRTNPTEQNFIETRLDHFALRGDYLEL